MDLRKWLWENSSKTWRHTQQIPEHVEGHQEHTERPQQCLPVANKDTFSEILEEAFRSRPIQDWYSATRGMLKAILNRLRQRACKDREPCYTHRDTNIGLLFDQFLAQPFGQNGDGMFWRKVHAVSFEGVYVSSNARWKNGDLQLFVNIIHRKLCFTQNKQLKQHNEHGAANY